MPPLLTKWFDSFKLSTQLWLTPIPHKCPPEVLSFTSKLSSDLHALSASNVAPGGVGTAMSVMQTSWVITPMTDGDSLHLSKALPAAPSVAAVSAWQMRNDTVSHLLTELTKYIRKRVDLALVTDVTKSSRQIPLWVSGPACSEYVVFQTDDVSSNLDLNSTSTMHQVDKPIQSNGISEQLSDLTTLDTVSIPPTTNKAFVKGVSEDKSIVRSSEKSSILEKPTDAHNRSYTSETTVREILTPLAAGHIKDGNSSVVCDESAKTQKQREEIQLAHSRIHFSELCELSVICNTLIFGESTFSPTSSDSNISILDLLIDNLSLLSVSNRLKVVILFDLLFNIPYSHSDGSKTVDDSDGTSTMNANPYKTKDSDGLPALQSYRTPDFNRYDRLKSYSDMLQDNRRSEVDKEKIEDITALMRPMIRYLILRPQPLEKICDGVLHPYLSNPCGNMLQVCIRKASELWASTYGNTQCSSYHTDTADSLEMTIFLRWLLMDNFFIAHWLTAVVNTRTFIVMSQGFELLRLILHSRCPASQMFLADFHSSFFASYRQTILMSHEYVCKRHGAKLLFDIISDPDQSRIMSKFIKDSQNLEVVINLFLCSEETGVVAEAFHLLKIFVLSPRKPMEIFSLLHRYRNDILIVVRKLQLENELDPYFVSDCKLTLTAMLGLKPVK